MDSTQQIKYGALLSYVSLGVNILAGLLYTPWMIGSIGKESYGLYTLAMSVISLFLFDFGLSSAVIRFLSKYLAEERQDKANSCLGLLYKLYIYVDVLLLVVLSIVYFFIPYIYKELTPDEIEQFKVVYAIAAVFSIVSFPFIPVNGVLSSCEKFIQLRICDVLHKVIVVVAMTICLLAGYGLYALVLVNAGAGIATIFMKWWCVKRFTQMRAKFQSSDRQQLRDIAGFSIWTTVIALCSRLIFSIAPTILGIFVGSVPIAIFGIANVLEGYVYSFSAALSGMFLPKVSRIIAQDGGDVLPLMIRVGRIQLMVVGAVVMGFVCAGDDFIRFWVGEGFSQSYICTVLLIVPSLFQLPQEIGLQTIIAKNEVKAQAIVWIVMALVNVVLSFLLTWLYGAVGLCVSICVAYFIRTIGLDVIFKTKLNIGLAEFFKRTFLHIGSMIFVVSAVTLLLLQFLPDMGVVSFIIKMTGFSLLYIVGILLVSNKEEKQLIYKPFYRIIRHG